MNRNDFSDPLAFYSSATVNADICGFDGNISAAEWITMKCVQYTSVFFFSQFVSYVV